PHHENEIAQSEAANGVEFSKYWMHNAFLNIDNKKMSKSEGNFFTVRDISEKYDLQVLRYFMLSAQYRTPLNFSAELMEAAKNGLERIVTCAHNLTYLSEHAAAPGSGAAGSTDAMRDDERESLTGAEQYVTRFEEAMDDDFNTADAISVVFELVKYINSHVSGLSSRGCLQAFYEMLSKLTDVLGLIVEKKEEILDEDIERLIAERQAARKEKNFARADEIRTELLEKGIVLEDTREGVKWKRA
ncbi:MAG: class I tRNA ligase family protein, partial [Lachnospiraceae bacterium]|nr:class I tRNA ligase family protein [Lachnospiraceae bacterium]